MIIVNASFYDLTTHLILIVLIKAPLTMYNLRGKNGYVSQHPMKGRCEQYTCNCLRNKVCLFIHTMLVALCTVYLYLITPLYTLYYAHLILALFVTFHYSQIPLLTEIILTLNSRSNPVFPLSFPRLTLADSLMCSSRRLVINMLMFST